MKKIVATMTALAAVTLFMLSACSKKSRIYHKTLSVNTQFAETKGEGVVYLIAVTKLKKHPGNFEYPNGLSLLAKALLNLRDVTYHLISVYDNPDTAQMKVFFQTEQCSPKEIVENLETVFADIYVEYPKQPACFSITTINDDKLNMIIAEDDQKRLLYVLGMLPYYIHIDPPIGDLRKKKMEYGAK